MKSVRRRKTECFSISQYGKEKAMIIEWGSWMGMRMCGEMGDWWGEVVESGVGMGVCGEGGLRTALSQFPDSQKFNNPLSPHSTPFSTTFFHNSQLSFPPFSLILTPTFFHFRTYFHINLNTYSLTPFHVLFPHLFPQMKFHFYY